MQELASKNTETKLYVRDLKPEAEVTDEQFREVFAQFGGEIKTFSVKTVTVRGVEKRFGMIDFATKEDAQTALT